MEMEKETSQLSEVKEIKTNQENQDLKDEEEVDSEGEDSEGEDSEGEATEEVNLYGNEDNKNSDATINYVNFEEGELSEFKDTFKDSKISTKDFEKFQAIIEEKASAKEFSKELIKTYGEQAPEVLKNYQDFTSSIFTEEEKEILNGLPSTYKILMVKMGKSLMEKYNKLEKDYGLTTKETQAMPEVNSINAKERFKILTNKLCDERLSADEYSKLMQERLELAKYLN